MNLFEFVEISKCTDLRTTPFYQYYMGVDLRTTPFGQYFLGIGLFQKWSNCVELAFKSFKSAYHPIWSVFSGDWLKKLNCVELALNLH